MDKPPRHVASLTAALILVALAVAVTCAVVLVRKPWAQPAPHRPATTTTTVHKPQPVARRPIHKPQPVSTSSVAPKPTPVVPTAPRPVPRPAPTPSTSPHTTTPSTTPPVCILLICVRP